MFIEKTKATLNERSKVIEWLLDKEWIKKEFSDDYSWWWEKLENITSKQKKYIIALLINNNRAKLNEVLKSILYG